MIFSLYIQKPKPPKKPLMGNLSLNEREAFIFDLQDRCIADIAKPEIIYAGPNGFMLRGFEQIGIESNGNKKYRYQEWYLHYLEQK